MKAKEELTKLIMESYDRGVKDTKQEALIALEKIVVVNNTCEKHCEATAFKIVIRGLEHEVAEEREACAKLVDHILKEGGGTWGDAIRARGEKQ